MAAQPIEPVCIHLSDVMNRHFMTHDPTSSRYPNFMGFIPASS